MKSARALAQLAPCIIVLATAIVLQGCAGGGGGSRGGQKKAIMMGLGHPFTDPNGGPTHAEAAKFNFLRLVNNPSNNPALGWTCDMSFDVIVSLGMNPTNTTPAQMFDALRRKRRGYRIVMQNAARGVREPYWTNALNAGIMPFAPQGNNNPGMRFDDPPGLFPAVSVAGGVVENTSSYGPGVEFIDALPNGDAAQSWANQVVAAKFAQILDEHRNYNIWDGRAFLRQSTTNYVSGWNERNGYGRPTADRQIQRLLPEPPVQFRAVATADGTEVVFTWRNFQQTRFRGTVIARGDGRIIYNGRGTRFVWKSDVNGTETFRYWSRDNSGQISTIQSYQVRTIAGLTRPD